jgi:hypothetical protein
MPARVKKGAQNAKVLESADNAAVMKLVDIGVSKSPAGNGVRVRVPPAAPISSELEETLAYVVGVALGDGNLSRPNGRATRLRITCDSQYDEVAEEITAALKLIFPLNKVSKVPRTDTYFDISVYSNNLDRFMPWKVNMGSKKIQKARVPEWIKTNLHLSQPCLRGLIQTDGCIYSDRGYKMVSFTNNTEELAEDVYTMLKLNGYRPNFLTAMNGEHLKHSVRIARKKEVESLIKKLHLYKA